MLLFSDVFLRCLFIFATGGSLKHNSSDMLAVIRDSPICLSACLSSSAVQTETAQHRHTYNTCLFKLGLSFSLFPIFHSSSRWETNRCAVWRAIGPPEERRKSYYQSLGGHAHHSKTKAQIMRCTEKGSET